MDFSTKSRFESSEESQKNHNFQDTPDDTCHCTGDAETSQHFLLHCTNFIEQRHKLFETLNPIMLENNSRFLRDRDLMHLLLYGENKSKLHENRSILKATVDFLKNTSRFSRDTDAL